MKRELTKNALRLSAIAALLLGVGGCMHPAPQGGVGDTATGGSLVGSSDSAVQPDYRETISQPGRF